MTPNEQAYWALCLAVAQQGYFLWLDRWTACMGLCAQPAPVVPRGKPRLTIVR